MEEPYWRIAFNLLPVVGIQGEHSRFVCVEDRIVEAPELPDDRI